MYNNFLYHNFTCIHMYLTKHELLTIEKPLQMTSTYEDTDNKENQNKNLTEEEQPKIKLLKNNKFVYVSETAAKIPYKKIKQKKKFTFINQGKRGSRFRGVSRNGNQWQVLIMINKSKSYVGSYSSESLAARIYDIVSLKNLGNKAKTNFNYTKNEITGLVCLDVKDKAILDKLKKILNENNVNSTYGTNENSLNSTYASCSVSC